MSAFCHTTALTLVKSCSQNPVFLQDLNRVTRAGLKPNRNPPPSHTHRKASFCPMRLTFFSLGRTAPWGSHTCGPGSYMNLACIHSCRWVFKNADAQLCCHCEVYNYDASQQKHVGSRSVGWISDIALAIKQCKGIIIISLVMPLIQFKCL